ncbi:MAG: S8 family peptidase [Nitrososphaerales archaeon]
MRFHLLPFLAILLALPLMPRPLPASGTEAPPPISSTGPRQEYRPGAVLVKFKPGSVAIGRATAAATGLEVTQEIQGLGVLDVAVPVGQEQAIVQQLSSRRDVDYAEVDYVASAQVEPNDPNYVSGTQWGLVKIGGAQAWEVTTGAPDLIIALVDSGIDLAHPDLASKLWKNTREVPNNGKDDDQNGCVDDVNGCRYRASSGVSGDGNVADDNGHGTHVAGIAAAATNNGAGVAGVSWQSPVMAVKVLDASGSGAYSDIAQGILYAANNGASVINLSLGGAAASQTLCDAVSAAVAKGKVVVAAAGNADKGRTVLYPAMCPGALAVGATNAADQRAEFSIPGPRVDLAAPGVQIMSTWYFTGLGQSGYRSEQGTSQAAPFVSGTAALVWARWPSLTAEGIKARLLGTVVDVGTPGKDDATGWGRLDAAAAVGALTPRSLYLPLTVR